MKKIYFSALLIFCAVSFVDAQKFVRENFEGGAVPSAWTADAEWQVGLNDNLASQYFNPNRTGNYIIYNDDAAGNTAGAANVSFTTEAFDLSAVTNASLIFDLYYGDQLYAGGQEMAWIDISTDGGTTWTEVSDLPTTMNEWVSQQVDLSAHVGGMAMLRVTYDDAGVWSYGIAMDDFLVINPLTNDILLGGFDAPRFVKETDGVSFPVTNFGTDPVTSLELTWNDGTNSYTETVTGLNIATFETMMVDHPQGLSGYGATEQNVTMTLTAGMVNGMMDEDATDNEAASAVVFSVVEEDFVKRMVAEEGTGTWCPWCPRGTVFMDQMVADFPDNFVGIAVHNNDPMVIAEHDNGVGTIIGGYPSVAVDRAFETDPSALPEAMQARMDNASPVNITAEANYVIDESKIEVSMTSTFYTEVTDRQFTFSAIVIEDGLTGTGSDWAQANNYAGGQFGPMGGYENLANPVPAADMVYDHVSRALIGGWNGMVGNFPAMVDNGTEIAHMMTIDVDPQWNTENLHIVVLVTDNTTGNIHNAMNVEIGGMFSPTTSVELEKFNLYPNPAQEVTQLTFELEEKKDVNVMIYNNMGQNVWSNNYGEMVGAQNFSLDLNGLTTGAYTLVIQLGDTEFVAKQLSIVE